MRARYVGPMNQLRNKRCLVDDSRAQGDLVLAQFNDLDLVVADKPMAHGWHPIKLAYLRLEFCEHGDEYLGCPECIADEKCELDYRMQAYNAGLFG